MAASLVPTDPPFSSPATTAERALLSGTLAASMERVARLAVTVLGAPAATLALLGTDRRTFRAGGFARPWISHDSGVLVRTGLISRALDNGGVLSLNDVLDERSDPAMRSAATELQVRSLALAALTRHDGTVLGTLLALSDEPRFWGEEDLQLLGDLAEGASTELQLRHALAEREMRERQLRHDSLHDALTGLPNRALFMKRLSDASLRARRDGDGLFAVLFLDLDDFKLVNDSMGHHVGDEVLVTVARRLEECVRGGDIVARLGGDEFAILLERVIDARDTALVADRVQHALKAPMTIGGYEWVTSASIGVVLSSSASERPEYLLRSADMAMYRAKHQGRSRFEMFDRAMHAEALTRLQLETDLRRAVERQEFLLHYQPIVSLADGRVQGVEALVRWQHADRGLISPNDFIPVAEDTGLIVPMGRWALREACQTVRGLEARVPSARGLRLSVNLSVREFAQLDLVRAVAGILDETGLPAGQLQLEITESAIIGQQHPALQTIAELRELGVRIHLDDFGTGYSSLSYLHRLPLDAIKIDRAFTTSMETEERPRHVVQAILSLVGAMGLEVIAEGVATADQLALLRRMGCPYGQGFLFSRPMPPAALEELLQRDPRW
ncbi:MAG TPA: EAL domain-containing protein [Gemmatimonadaceae bacterium]|nr:EAL domain-containing protein [Gemmatimonadota bacterium]HNV76862.1 EAL domain-containing protein [Gemmatimonadaceae bacterium]MBK7834640.1 EAL domain-containing protein [Gemmatimonadota bacterium]MBK8056606.1 EAL domain-containing protein [Gemmatimonadota bacterium]MBK8647069.1 EAL domain-containing protein [Gemmatimonadota bacterium]